jgi:hypothetical protein
MGPQFIEKVHDICDLYLNPPERAVVLAVGDRANPSLGSDTGSGITSGTAPPPACAPRSTCNPAKRSASCTPATAPSSS